MTCQWCISYRRRDGIVMCKCADGKIRKVPADLRADKCKRFNPRRNCTTCGHGCSQDDKAAKPFGECPNWELRVLSTWGGSRRWPKKTADCKPTEQPEKEKEQ